MIDQRSGEVIKSYELQDLIGTGGFGAVYRARQAVVEREVAIKIIWPAFANHPNFIRRFETEAQLVAGLEHPHIVPLYDYWRDPDGAYIVMRYLRGGHLGSILTGEPLEMQDADRIMSQMLAALALAHRFGVVHRDLKPANILLDETHNAYLADFGIAQILSNTQEEDDMLSSMGSPAYASPEQVAGNKTSARSDVYSLGVILYEMLTGEHPFPDLENLSMTQLLAVRTAERVPSLRDKRPDLPDAIDDVVQLATAIDPDKRLIDAQSLMLALRSATKNLYASTNWTSAATDAIIFNPYKGLRPFQEADAANFFGREALIQRFIKRLQEDSPYARFLAVVGPSGSGKSSVVKAGLIPQLRHGALPNSDQWFYEEFVPGELPFDELENVLIGIAVGTPQNLRQHLRAGERGLLEVANAILPDDDTELFLFIDQFEELFTLVDDENEINHFLSSIYTAVTDALSRIRVVITIRADFYDRPLLQPQLSDLMRERTEVVVPLSPSELERSIVEPARRAGIQIDTGLVAAIVAEVKEQPASLPLLQYSLSELFERREGGIITPDAYRALGGVRGSLARRADELYESLSNREQDVTRQLFLRLITLGEGTEDTRRRALLSELTSMQRDDEVEIIQAVIRKLGNARLLTFDRDPVTRSPTIEVTHEAIIREWHRLRSWLDESRTDVRMQRTLSGLAAEWDNNGRDPSFLLRGARLDSYARWSRETNLALTAQEYGFLQAAVEEHERREAEEHARQARETALERQSLNRLRALAVVLTLAMVVAFILTGLAFTERNRATENAEQVQIALATSDANAALSQSIAWESGARRALGDSDVDLAVLLALAANDLENPPPQSRSTLSEVAFSAGTQKVLREHDAWVQSVDISPDGRHLVSASTDATVKIWDLESGSLIHDMSGHGGDVESVRFSPDGRTVASGASDFLAILWDVEQGTEIRRFIGHDRPVRSAVFSPDGQRLLTGSSDTTLILWDVATANILQRYTGHAASVLAVAYHPAGTMALSGSRDGTLLQWNLQSGEIIHRFMGHTTAITDAAYNLDGSRAVTSSGDGDIIVWDTAAGSIVQRAVGNTEEVRSVTFSPDGAHIYSALITGEIRVWDVATGFELRRLEGHSDSALSVTVDDTGQVAASGSKDTTIRVWNIGQPGAALQIEQGSSRITDLAFSTDGSRIYTTSIDGLLHVWDAQAGTQIMRYALGTPLMALSLFANDSSAFLGTRDGELLLLNLADGTISQRWRGHSATVEDVIVLRDEQRALSASLDDQIILWDLHNASALQLYAGHEDSVYDLALMPDESAFASASSDERVLLWDLEAGTMLREYTGHASTIFAVDIDANGELLASGSRDGFVILWDVASGQEVAQLVGDVETVWTLDFDGQGKRLVTGSSDATILIWDVRTISQLQRFVVPENDAFAVAFQPGGEMIASAHNDGQIFGWLSLSTSDLIDWVFENRYIRDFTCVEREQFRIVPMC